LARKIHCPEAFHPAFERVATENPASPYEQQQARHEASPEYPALCPPAFVRQARHCGEGATKSASWFKKFVM
jgi:hypothetical protein